MKAELESITIYPDSFAVDGTLRIDFFGAQRTLKFTGSLQQTDTPIVALAAAAAAKIATETVTLPAAKPASPKRATQPAAKPKPPKSKTPANSPADGGAAKDAYESWQDSILAILSRDPKDAFTKTELYDHVLMRRYGKDMRGTRERNQAYQSFWAALKTAIERKLAKQVEQDGLPKISKGTA